MRRVPKASCKLWWNGQQERATSAKRFEKQCCAFYHLRSNQAVASCVNTDFWLDKITRESQHTRKLRHLSAKQVELLCTFYNNFLPPATSWFVARQVWFVGGKTRKTAFQHVCSNVAKQVARFCGLIYRIFTLNKTDNHESREVQGIIGFFILLGEHEYHIFLCHTLGGSPPAAPFVLFVSNRDVEKASITKE